jgi:hypothetical protein
MAYIATNYMTNTKAPVGQWACAPTSELGPYDKAPKDQKSWPDYCGQCVSFAKQACPSLPETGAWRQGKAVRDNTDIVAGTIIATFDDWGCYKGHAAVFVRQDTTGIYVYDQWIEGNAPKAVGPRTLRWGSSADVNNGDKFYVVE